MRKFIALIAILFTLTASAQNNYYSIGSLVYTGPDTAKIDTTHIKWLQIGEKKIAVKDLFKKDTVTVPVYIIQKTDTAKQATELIVEGNKGRLYKAKGYYVFIQQLATTDGKQYQPVGQPQIVGAIDEKKKPVKLFRQ